MASYSNFYLIFAKFLEMWVLKQNFLGYHLKISNFYIIVNHLFGNFYKSRIFHQMFY